MVAVAGCFDRRGLDGLGGVRVSGPPTGGVADDPLPHLGDLLRHLRQVPIVEWEEACRIAHLYIKYFNNTLKIPVSLLDKFILQKNLSTLKNYLPADFEPVTCHKTNKREREEKKKKEQSSKGFAFLDSCKFHNK